MPSIAVMQNWLTQWQQIIEVNITEFIGRTSFSLREHDIYHPTYNPDFSFTKQTATIVRATSTTSSMGKAYIFAVFDRTWLNGKYFRCWWEWYISIGTGQYFQILIYDGSYDRTSDTDFPFGSDFPLKGAGLLQTVASHGETNGSATEDVLINTSSGTQASCTVFFWMWDDWEAPSLWFQVDWVEINTGSGGSGNLWSEHFTDPVTMEMTGTHGDYGYIGIDTSIGDAPVCNLIRDKTISESLGPVSDAVLPILRRVREISEPAVFVSDLAAAEIFLPPYIERSVNEPAISASDAVELILRRVRDVAEPAISVGDMPSVSSIRVLGVSEPAISVLDSPVTALIRMLSVNEPSISVLDSPTYSLIRALAVAEDLGSVSDIVEIALRRIIDISEPAISVNDVPSYNLIRDKVVNESLGPVADAVDYSLTRAVDILELPISVSDAVSYALQRTLIVGETPILVSDLVTWVLIRDIEVSEPGIGVSDLISYLLQRDREVYELPISVSDLPSAGLFKQVDVLEPPISISDFPTVTSLRSRDALEQLGPLGDFTKVEVITPGVLAKLLRSEAQYLESLSNPLEAFFKSIAQYLEGL